MLSMDDICLIRLPLCIVYPMKFYLWIYKKQFFNWQGGPLCFTIFKHLENAVRRIGELATIIKANRSK